jgi:hypothetical protein
MWIKNEEAPENWRCFRKIAMTVARTDRKSKDSMKSRSRQKEDIEEEGL